MQELARVITRRYLTLGHNSRFAMACFMLCAIAGSAVCWQIDRSMNQILIAHATSRALDQVYLGIRDHVTADDFIPPYSQAKLDELSGRLSPILARARQRGSGVLRVNLFARDGTIIYSDLASLRGQVVSPMDDASLGQALGGSFGAEPSAFARVENAGLKPVSETVLEAYVPFRLDGQVVGAYELYTEVSATRPGLGLWASVAGGFAALALAMIIVASWTFGDARRVRGVVISPQSPALLSATNGNPVCSLTKREVEVLQLMATNRSYAQIAAELVVSDETVRTHVRNIFHKLRQPDRVHAVAAAFESGILQLPIGPSGNGAGVCVNADGVPTG